MASTASATMLLTKPIPSTVRNAAIRTRLGSARPMIDVPIATPEPRWKWPSTTPSGSATTIAIAERGAGQLELLERLLQEEARVVGDELERIDERVRFAVSTSVMRGLSPPTARARGAARRAAGRSVSASAIASSAGRVDLGLERRRLLQRDEDRVAEALRQQERGDRARSRPSRRPRSAARR